MKRDLGLKNLFFPYYNNKYTTFIIKQIPISWTSQGKKRGGEKKEGEKNQDKR